MTRSAPVLCVLLLCCTPPASDSEAVVPSTACNGSNALCDRPLSEVSFPATHNSAAAIESGFYAVNANQQSGLATQLDDGIRAMLLDVHLDDNDETALCHGPCGLGSIPHLEGLAVLRDFLDAEPREVLVLLYQDEVPTERLTADLEASGLADLTYTHPGGPWPTLGDLIDADQRLVVTVENSGPPPAWVHGLWDLAWDTPYDFPTAADFSCDLNRGARENDLFLLNHWVPNEHGFPSAASSAEVNTFDVLHGRAQECWSQAGHQPTFVAVDFYEEGDLFDVVDALNGR